MSVGVLPSRLLHGGADAFVHHYKGFRFNIDTDATKLIIRLRFEKVVWTTRKVVSFTVDTSFRGTCNEEL